MDNIFKDALVSAGTSTTEPQIVGRVGQAADALRDWARKYPSDPQLGRAFFLGFEIYSRIWTKDAQQQAWHFLNIIVQRWPNSYFGRLARNDIAVGYTAHYYSIAEPCPTPSPSPIRPRVQRQRRYRPRLRPQRRLRAAACSGRSRLHASRRRAIADAIIKSESVADSVTDSNTDAHADARTTASRTDADRGAAGAVLYEFAVTLVDALAKAQYGGRKDAETQNGQEKDLRPEILDADALDDDAAHDRQEVRQRYQIRDPLERRQHRSDREDESRKQHTGHQENWMSCTA